MFIQSLPRCAFLICFLFSLENGFGQVKQEIPAELIFLTDILSKPLPDIKNNIKTPIRNLDIPSPTFRLYETGFFLLKKPDSLQLFGSSIQKIMVSIGIDTTVYGVFVTISKNDTFVKIASQKLGTESGKWSYESSFGSLKDDSREERHHVWNIGSYIIGISDTNDYYRTSVDDKDRYVLTVRRKVSL
ncbi:hypothetical protein [Chitinophaga filiformis]|uniref:Uncharacterized protein n=1 Tax=Chitinophaga filiformis TaxID=104663 RepID=A0A1G7LZR8_CHIFI|nr:hypothetical protein [Chitinophaga filiformis]SDF54449.1 hypothetical protein SAMN04488121_102229 [Chitinophaga filiformis]